MEAINLLVPYLCEQGFSAIIEMKSKKLNSLLLIDEEKSVSLSTSEARLDLICSLKEAQASK